MKARQVRRIRRMLRHKWMLWPRLESLQTQEDIWRQKVLLFNEGAARDFAYEHFIRVKRLKVRMKKRLGMHIWKKGVCEICGCTEKDPCFNPYWGYCWWVDEEHSLCSHCDIYAIQQDPHTKHCVNSHGHVESDAGGPKAPW